MRSSRRSLLKNLGLSLVALGLGSRTGNARESPVGEGTVEGHGGGGATMLILRGIAGHFAGQIYPHGALDEPAALDYAKRRGYLGRVLDASGEAHKDSPQVVQALAAIRRDQSISALYGFSGGGYNAAFILEDLTDAERDRIKLVIVLGAPKNSPDLYKGPRELVYRSDPGHMSGPRALLRELVSTLT
jgi:hypothetical protein